MYISTKNIRKRFIKFFEQKNHQTLPSSQLIPENDSTLMFTSAGMVQFKNVFLGLESAPHKRIATIQKCLRAGGKHNDIEQIGKTKRHHTFFEMLGNFSFDAYFKKEAILMAWEFLTHDLKLESSRMIVTVHKNDPESLDIWLSIIKREKIVAIDSNDNFWSMGDIGPCGYCTEIFYDLGSQNNGTLSEQKYDPDERFLEIWNIVFMGFEKTQNGSIIELNKKYVDTGIGLERIASVCQNVTDNYSIDLFKSIMKKSIGFDKNFNNIVPHKIIADHARSCTFMISEGIVPSNVGSGYVLRRIIRRAINQSYKINQDINILSEVIPAVIKEMKEEYPEIEEREKAIIEHIKMEEGKFKDVLINGLSYLNENLDTFSKIASPDLIFKLYDTYGFPIDLTEEILSEQSFSYDSEKVRSLMQEQQERGKKSWQGKINFSKCERNLNEYEKTTFLHHTEKESQSTVIGIFDKDENPVKITKEGEKITLILNSTPFYGESGGQIGDRGIICNDNGQILAKVLDTQLTPNKEIAIHKCESLSNIKINQIVIAKIDKTLRRSIKRNHSATHLLHSALQKIENPNILQKGSCVTDSHLRFDFNLTGNLQNACKIEDYINQIIEMEIEPKISYMSMANAKELGAMAIFNDKYDNSNVRVVEFSNEKRVFSIELCGGTHVSSTAEILAFKITSISSIGSGLKRIEAITGMKAISMLNNSWQYLQSLEAILASNKNTILEKARNLTEKIKSNDKIIEKLEGEITTNAIINKLIDCQIIQSSKQQKDIQVKKIKSQNLNIVLVQIPHKEIKYTNAEKLFNYYFAKENEMLIIIEPCSAKYMQYNLLSSNVDALATVYEKISNKKIKGKTKNNYIKFGAPISEENEEKEIIKISNLVKDI